MKEHLRQMDHELEVLAGMDMSAESTAKEIDNVSTLVKAAKILSDIDRDEAQMKANAKIELRKLELEEKKLEYEREKNEEQKKANIEESKSRRKDRWITALIGFASVSVPAAIYFVADLLHRKDEKEDFYMMSSSGKANRNNMKAR